MLQSRISDKPMKTDSLSSGVSLCPTLTWSFPLESVLILNQKMREATGKLLSFGRGLWNETFL